MALSKFSSFKKERSTIKESRLKEAKVKKFNKLFSEKLKDLKVASVADLSEDQMDSFLESLKKEKVVNEDRAREIEADVIAAGKPQELGSADSESESERSKKYNTVPKSSEELAEDHVEGHDEEVDEAKKAVKEDEEDDGVETKDKGEEEEDKGGEEEDKGDVKVDSEDDAEKADHYKGAVKSDDAEIETDKKEIKALKKDADFDKKEEEEEEELEESVVNEKLAKGLKPLLTIGLTITKKTGEEALLKLSDDFDALGDEDADNIGSHLNMAIELMQDGYPGDATKKLKQFNKACKDVLAGKKVGSAFESVTESSILEAKEIKSDAEFDKYADEMLKKAHPDDFDEKIAKKVKDGLKKKYGDDYGAAVGALSSGFGG